MFKRNPPVNYLDLVPVRVVQEYTEDSGKITLLIPKFKSQWLRNWFVPGKRSKYLRIHLDDMGSKVWLLIDGKLNTGELCAILKSAEEEAANPENQIEWRVTIFLSQLFKHKFIKFSG